MSHVICGDCLEVMQTFDDNCVDAIVTDPPYGLKFMNKDWDHGVPGKHFWEEALRISKPGSHLLAFGGTRTYHRLACEIEDAGWEIRDCLMWLYGSGFPKGHNLKGVFEGWGTALKPAWEPVIVARKTIDGTVALNVLTYGTGAINIDGCRVGDFGGTKKANPPKLKSNGIYGDGINGNCGILNLSAGRWPSNLIIDTEVSEMLGEVSRFFYCAKSSPSERGDNNNHPTVKPLSLMQYLCKLVTPPGGVVLDPFCGSGSTLIAAWNAGFNFIGIELNPEYIEIAKARLDSLLTQTKLPGE